MRLSLTLPLSECSVKVQIYRLVPVTEDFPITVYQFGYLYGRAACSVMVFPFGGIALGMSEIDYVGSFAADNNIGVVAHYTIVGSLARFGQ